MPAKKTDASTKLNKTPIKTKKNALNCVSVFLKTKFDGGRHTKRIMKI